MRKRLIMGIVCASVAFVAVNFFLLVKANSPIERLSYVSSWDAVQEADIAKTIKVAGIIEPHEEYPVYFYDKNNSFTSFHVEKGDDISVGTSLFGYTIDDATVEKERLERERIATERKIARLEESIDRVDDSLAASADEEDVNNDTLTYFAMEKELQLDFLHDELQAYDERLAQLRDDPHEQTVSSDNAGTVKQINYDLTNPIMTISSSLPVVAGVITEKDVQTITEGMKAYVSIATEERTLTGEITRILPFSNRSATAEQPSEYPFTISLSEDMPLRIDTHVEIQIVLDEALAARTIPTASIVEEGKDSFVFVITSEGTIQKQPIQTGLRVADRQEVIEGIAIGDIFIVDPEQIHGDNNRFFTRINTSHFKRKAYDELTKRQRLAYMTYGFFN